MKKWFSVRKWILPVGLGILTLLPIVGVDIAHAQVVASLGDSDALKGLAEIAAVGINIFTFLALLIINFFSDLIGTDFIIGDQAMNAIKPMWIIVRNLVNVMFVVMLVFLAFSNLFASIAGEGGGNWTIKEKLPKILISLVAINFSLLGFRLIIDAVNVGTIAILGIADHKLEGDNQVSMGGFVSERTWIKLASTEAEGKTQTDGFKDSDDVKEGTSCTAQHERFMNNPASKLTDDEIIIIKADTSDNSTGNATYACRTFAAQINNTFCPQWKDHAKLGEIDKDASQLDKDQKNSERMTAIEGDVNCMFMMNTNKLSSETILQARNAPGQNLFMAFGTVFMHLEKLPSLAAHLGSLDGVLINTLFSALMSIMFLVALVAVFIALLGRVVILWVALVFSPVLVVAKIMEFDAGSGDISTQIVTAIIMPLKIAAAFAVGFVMLSAMVTISPGMTGGESTFWFGAALSQMGQDEYAILWQVATVFLFWKAARWSIEGNMAESITNGIFDGAQKLGEVAARSATIDRPIFGASTGKGGFSLATLAKMPQAYANKHTNDMTMQLAEMKSAFGLDKSGKGKKTAEMLTSLNTWNEEKKNRLGGEIGTKMKSLGTWLELSNKDVLKALAKQDKLKDVLTEAEINSISGSASATKLFFEKWDRDKNSGLAKDSFKDIKLGTEATTDKTETTETEPGKTTGEEGNKKAVLGTEGNMYTKAQLGEANTDKLKGVEISPKSLKEFADANDMGIAAAIKLVTGQGGTVTGAVVEKKTQGVYITDRRGNVLNTNGTIKGADNEAKLTDAVNKLKGQFKDIESADQGFVVQKMNDQMTTEMKKTHEIVLTATGLDVQKRAVITENT